MKTLFIMRHAKSSWKDPRLDDHRRPLNKRGKKTAPTMGQRLKEKGVQLDVIVSSDARRAVDTAASVAGVLGLSSEDIREMPELYHASPDRILDIVKAFPDHWKQVMLVGHNPGLTELANRYLSPPIASIPTAGIVELRFESLLWREIEPACLGLSWLDFPKNN